MLRKLVAGAVALGCLVLLHAEGETRLAPPAEAASAYTCPMHPEVTDDKPSRCPKCKMKLVPK